MAEQEHHELIIVRRHEEEEHEAHSSAWKVAHADFMTAMMAFFLIMWLLNATDEEVRKSIANYFNPVNLSESVTDRKGLNDPKDVTPQGPEKEGDQKTTLGQKTNAEGQEGAASTHETDTKEGKQPKHDGEPDAHGQPAAGHGQASVATPGSAEAKAMAAAEEAAFADPYAVLAKLAGEATPQAPSADVPIGETGAQGVMGGDAYRDPFDPVYWQMDTGSAAKARAPGKAGTAGGVPSEGRPDAAAVSTIPDPIGITPDMPGARPSDAPPPAAAQAAAEPPPAPAPDAAATKPPQSEQAMADTIGSQLAQAIQQNVGSAQAPHVEVKATSEGVLVSLTDDLSFSMFEIGSAIPKPSVVVAMDQVAKVLASEPGRIVIRGYTDGRPFHSENYDNWRLSTARAHMAYYMLTRDGALPESRFARIEGYADHDLKNPEDPNAAENRRIEILLQPSDA